MWFLEDESLCFLLEFVVLEIGKLRFGVCYLVFIKNDCVYIDVDIDICTRIYAFTCIYICTFVFL